VMSQHRSVAVLLLLASTMPQLAMAQDKDPVTESARRRFQEGVRFYDEKRFEEARAAFLQAYALKHHPSVLLNLAQSELRGTHPLEAARHFSSYLRESTTASPTERAEAEKGLATARTKTGRLQINVSASGADVLVNNESVGQAPLPDVVDVAPGTHAVEARLGGKSVSASAAVVAGKISVVTLTIEPAAPLAPTAVSRPVGVVDSAAPRANDEIAAPGIGSEGAPSPSPSDGREGFFSWLGHSGVGLTGVGVTAIGLGLFAGFGIAGMKAADNADNVAAKIAEHGAQSGSTRTSWCSPPIEEGYQLPCETLRDNLDKRDTDRSIATVGIIAAGVGLTTTVTAYFLSARRTNETPATAITPVIGPRFTGLSLGGAF